MMDLHTLRTDKVLGVGCSTFGGSTAPKAARLALARAYEQGVVYFDVARSYGYGQAESLVGQFVRDKRDKVLIASKCGIVPPQLPLRPLVLWGLRQVRQALPTSRNALTSAGTQALKRPPITPRLIEDSLHTSLRELNTEYIDILLLHESSHAEAGRDEVRRVLEKAKEQGKIRTWGATLANRACLQEQLRSTAPLDVVQFPFGLDATYHEVTQSAAAIQVVYSVLNYYKSAAPGIGPALLAELQAEFPALRFLNTLPELYLYLAIQQLPAGVVLSSMTTPANIDRNVFLWRKSLDAPAAEGHAIQARLARQLEIAPALPAGTAKAVR